MPSHIAPIHSLPDKYRSHSIPSLPFSLKKTVLLAGMLLIGCIIPEAGSTATINNGNLTSTFGNGSDNLDLENNGTITVYGNGMAAGDNSTLQNNGAITINSYRAYGMTATSGSDLTNGKTGTITLNNSSSSGLYVSNSGTQANTSVTNNGTITGKAATTSASAPAAAAAASPSPTTVP